MEILIVMAIIILLIMLVFVNLRKQNARAMDIQRKTDLYKIRKSFEDYSNDHGAFPAITVVDNCGGADMTPYLAKIPCDPASKQPYGYFTAQNTGYRICAILADTTDPDIATMGCLGAQGCGVGGGFNYCLSSGVASSAIGTVDQVAGPTPTPTATPAPSPTPGSVFACAPPDFQGISRCNSYADPVGSGCPIWYGNPTCSNACGNSSNWCQQ